jgi:nanoRNase/pAp phosphatase (c-di-AMP/oligoRNAs hydrolase)
VTETRICEATSEEDINEAGESESAITEMAVASLRVARVDPTAIVAHTITAGLVADAESRGLA